MKRCSICGVEKPLETGFHRASTNRDGRQGRCKDCQKAATYRYREQHRDEYAAYQHDYIRRYYAENKEQIRQQHAAYRETHRDEKREADREYAQQHADQIRQRKAVWYGANRPRLLAKNQARYQANRTEHMARQRRWVLTQAGASSARRAKRAYERRHPEQNAIRNARRYARVRGATVLERIDRLAIAERDGWICHICKQPIPKDRPPLHPESLTLDHLVPLAHGGNHSTANVAAAHRRCNIRRGPGRIAAQLRLLG